MANVTAEELLTEHGIEANRLSWERRRADNARRFTKDAAMSFEDHASKYSATVTAADDCLHDAIAAMALEMDEAATFYVDRAVVFAETAIRHNDYEVMFRRFLPPTGDDPTARGEEDPDFVPSAEQKREERLSGELAATRSLFMARWCKDGEFPYDLARRQAAINAEIFEFRSHHYGRERTGDFLKELLWANEPRKILLLCEPGKPRKLERRCVQRGTQGNELVALLARLELGETEVLDVAIARLEEIYALMLLWSIDSSWYMWWERIFWSQAWHQLRGENVGIHAMIREIRGF